MRTDPGRRRPRAAGGRLRAVAVAGVVLVLVLVGGVVALALTRLEAAESTAVTQHPAASAFPSMSDPRIETAALIGDSVAAGAGSSDSDHAFATLVADYEGWQLQNFAGSGAGYVPSAQQDGMGTCGNASCTDSSDVFARVQQYDPTLVVVSAGADEVGVDQQRVDDGVETFYGSLRRAAPRARIIAISPLWGAGAPPVQLGRIARATEAAVREVGGTYLDVGQPLRDRPEFVSGAGVQPNDRGHAEIARVIEVALSRTAAD